MQKENAWDTHSHANLLKGDFFGAQFTDMNIFSMEQVCNF